MQLSSVNSLFEVGIGVNLAFGAFKGMRDGLYIVFSDLLKTQSNTIQAQLDGVVANGGGKASLVIKTEDIRNDYADLGRKVTYVMVAVALLSACVLLFYLTKSAITPTKVVEDWKVYPTLGLVAGPIVTAALSQIILYVVARMRLSNRLTPYKHFIDVTGEITPKPPTA